MKKTDGLIRMLLGIMAAAVFLIGYGLLHRPLALWIAGLIFAGANVWFIWLLRRSRP